MIKKSLVLLVVLMTISVCNAQNQSSALEEFKQYVDAMDKACPVDKGILVITSFKLEGNRYVNSSKIPNLELFESMKKKQKKIKKEYFKTLLANPITAEIVKKCMDLNFIMIYRFYTGWASYDTQVTNPDLMFEIQFFPSEWKEYIRKNKINL